MPLHTTYATRDCPVAAALDVVGQRWTLLVIRELFLGVRRFDEIQADLGVARNVLGDRLQRLVAAGVVERRRYCEHPPRDEYRLTDAGLELWPTLVSLMRWGDRHARSPQPPAVVLEHRGCGGGVDDHLSCERCGVRLGARDVQASAGPGAGEDHPLRRRLAPSAG